ncbi:hypothetical protein ACU4GA_18850 [Methylobacterium oryzae CBMB20]
MLSGKKSAIGIIGAVVTQILSQVPLNTGLGQLLAQITPAFGLSPYTMPIFIGLAAWGVLGETGDLEHGSRQADGVAGGGLSVADLPRSRRMTRNPPGSGYCRET